MESIVKSRSQIFSVAGELFIVFGVHRMVAEGARSNQKLLALREKGVYSSYTLFTLPNTMSAASWINTKQGSLPWCNYSVGITR
jgi:hypothetical protein